MIKVGVIGLGYWGPNLIRNFTKVPNTKVVLACDLDQSRREAFAARDPNIKVVSDYAEFFGQVDAVVIATPLPSHFPLATAFLQQGTHVLVEKPFVASSPEAKTLIELAKAKKAVLMVDHTFEYADTVGKIKALFDQKVLGKIYNIEMVRVNLGLFQKDYDVVWDLAPHDLSILIDLLGSMPQSVIALGEAFVQKKVVENAHLYLRFPHGVVASLYLSWLSPTKIRKLTVVGSKKMLEYDDTALETKIHLFDKGVSLEPSQLPKMPYYQTFKEFRYVYRQGSIKPVNLKEREPLFVMAKHFVDCIRKGVIPKTSGQEALKVIKIIEAAQESMKAGGREVTIK